MKTTLRFKVLGILIALLLGIFTSSCTKDEPISALETNISENLQLKNGSIPPGDVYCDLIAGQTIPVGQVIISHDDDYLYVTYLTSNGWTLSEVHLYVGTLDGLPMNKTAVKIGQFPYSASNLNGLTTYTFNVPLAGLASDEDGYAIFAHAVVTNGEQEETAWSNGCGYKPLITVKSWFNNSVNSANSWWAASSGDRFSNNPSDWCYHLGTNIYSEADTYSFESDRASVVNPGHIEVSDDGSQLFVDVYANNADGYTLDRTYVYVGNMAGLQAYVVGSCPDYTNFPNQNLTEANIHSFTFPFITVANQSFNTIGINRWGWFFYYKL